MHVYRKEINRTNIAGPDSTCLTHKNINIRLSKYQPSDLRSLTYVGTIFLIDVVRFESVKTRLSLPCLPMVLVPITVLVVYVHICV